MYADAVFAPYLDCLLTELPALKVFDAHTHLGRNDPDGFKSDPERLLRSLGEVDGRAAVFPMHEPEGYPPANDMVLEEAARSGGRLVAFCRVDPNTEAAVAEAQRCLDAGARGIKLHPRSDGFALDHPTVDALAELAAERRVPIITHAGRGIPALGRHALQLCERHPGARLILAHAGICDLAWIWGEAESHPNLFFDSSWWAAPDLLALFALVPPGQVLYGSDIPFGGAVQMVLVTLRCALQAGLDAEQLEAVMGGQLERLVKGDDAVDLGPAPGAARIAADPLLDRVHAFLHGAVSRIFAGGSPYEQFELARLACEVGDQAPQAPVCRAVRDLLDQVSEPPARTARKTPPRSAGASRAPPHSRSSPRSSPAPPTSPSPSPPSASANASGRRRARWNSYKNAQPSPR